MSEPAEAWAADGSTLIHNGRATGFFPSDEIAEWVAEACNTLAEIDQAQAEWEASGEAPNCAVVNIGGEQTRVQGGAEMPEQLRDAMADVVGAARRAMAEAKAAEREEIQRQVREEIAARIEAADADPSSEYERGLAEAARIARGDR